MGYFDNETDPLLRNQILTYLATAAMTDRERARALGLPEGCRIREGAKILAIDKLQCGKYVWIGEGAVLDAQGGLSVGDYTQIGLNVMVWSHSSHWQALWGKTGVSSEAIIYTPTRIGACCFIGGPSVIMPGVTIGDKVIVPPMSVVDRDLADRTVFRNANQVLAALEKRLSGLEARLDAMGANRA